MISCNINGVPLMIHTNVCISPRSSLHLLIAPKDRSNPKGNEKSNVKIKISKLVQSPSSRDSVTLQNILSYPSPTAKSFMIMAHTTVIIYPAPRLPGHYYSKDSCTPSPLSLHWSMSCRSTPHRYFSTPVPCSCYPNR